MSKKIILIYFLLVGSLSFGQLDYGFYGKKNAISLTTYSAFNAFFSMDQGFSYLKYNEQGVEESKAVPFRTSIRFKYARLISERVSLGVELGYLPVRGAVTYGKLNGYYWFAPFFHTFAVTPVFQFHSGMSNIGFNGYTLEFGAGPSFSFLKRPKAIYSENGENAIELLAKTEKPIVGVNIFIGFSKSIPLNHGLYLDFGIRTGTHFIPKSKITFSDGGISHQYLKRLLHLRLIYSVVDFKLGFTYQF